MKNLKAFVKFLFNSIGFDIRHNKSSKRFKKIEHEMFLKENKWLTDYQFCTIIDIGANEGQFAKKARNLFPNSLIISFEPIPTIYENLKASFLDDKRFKSFNVGLGQKEEKMKLWLNEYTPSSSILKMNRHTEHFDFAVKQNQIEIRIDQLDNYKSEFDSSQPYMVKIDVQGYEDKVIKGGKEIIKNAQLIITEVSFSSLYQEQVLFDQIYMTLKDMGFKYAGNYEQLYSPVNNEVLQADAIFIKEL